MINKQGFSTEWKLGAGLDYYSGKATQFGFAYEIMSNKQH